jgi:hypothetical protein
MKILNDELRCRFDYETEFYLFFNNDIYLKINASKNIHDELIVLFNLYFNKK